MEGVPQQRHDREGDNQSLEQSAIEKIKRKRLEWFQSGINDEVNEAIVDWFNDTKEKYPDIRDYLLVHALIGSTPASEVTKLDLPGDDSVQLFVKTLSEKLAKEQ
jgi:hypothetical protein